MICFFNKYKKSVQKHTDFFDNSFFNAVPDKPLATRNKSHNNQLCADLFHFISAYPVVSHFLRFAWQTTPPLRPYRNLRRGAFLLEYRQGDEIHCRRNRKRLPPLLRKHIKYSRNRRNGKRINLKNQPAGR